MSAPILDHSCDGIEELDNPLPRWWLYLFYVTIIFSFGYAIYYPSFWFWPGTSGWSQEKQWAETKIVKTASAAVEVSLTALAAKPEVLDAGKKLFMSNCASCHGLNAEGKIGPCLTDSVWKYGNEDKIILETITKGRPGGMPAWGTFLKPDQITTVGAYIHSIGNTTATPANTTTATPAPASATPAAVTTSATPAATATPAAGTGK